MLQGWFESTLKARPIARLQIPGPSATALFQVFQVYELLPSCRHLLSVHLTSVHLEVAAMG